MRYGVSQGLALHYITENTGNTERAGHEGREREEETKRERKREVEKVGGSWPGRERDGVGEREGERERERGRRRER